MRPLRILVADDHDLVRRGIRSLFQARPNWKIVGEAVTNPEAVEKAKRSGPDVILLDVNMPGLSPIEAVRRLRSASPSSAILILTMDESAQTMRLLLNEEIRGYVFKSDFDGDLVKAVEEVGERRRFFTSKACQTMYEALGGQSTRHPGGDRAVSWLTPRQHEVIRLVAAGKSNKEVAQALGIGTRTAEAHRAHVMAKLGFKTFSELVRYAVREHIIEP
jgi:DNA-binding NarL/FixJ family response regulator